MPHPPFVGIDFVEPERLAERLSGSPGLDSELFTPDELEYCRVQAFAQQHLAARWCAKEAVVKALGLDGWDPQDIEVVGGGAEVALALHGAARDHAEALGVEVSISMTHLPGMAGAVAMARQVIGRGGPSSNS